MNPLFFRSATDSICPVCFNAMTQIGMSLSEYEEVNGDGLSEPVTYNCVSPCGRSVTVNPTSTPESSLTHGAVKLAHVDVETKDD